MNLTQEELEDYKQDLQDQKDYLDIKIEVVDELLVKIEEKEETEKENKEELL